MKSRKCYKTIPTGFALQSLVHLRYARVLCIDKAIYTYIKFNTKELPVSGQYTIYSLIWKLPISRQLDDTASTENVHSVRQ